MLTVLQFVVMSIHFLFSRYINLLQIVLSIPRIQLTEQRVYQRQLTVMLQLNSCSSLSNAVAFNPFTIYVPSVYIADKYSILNKHNLSIVPIYRALRISENNLLQKWRFFKTMIIQWSLCYISKILYLEVFKIKICGGLQDRALKTLKTSPTARCGSGAVFKPRFRDHRDKQKLKT